MASEQQAINPNPTAMRYHGQNKYVDIATRNEGEFIGMGLGYAPHPNGKGYFVVRFVSRGVKQADLKHFTYRTQADFCSHSTGQKTIITNGARLNKIAVQAFDPAIYETEVAKYAEQFGMWDKLAAWITEQVQAEGFMLTVDLKQELASNFVTPTTVEVKDALEFPALDAPPPPSPKKQHTKADDEGGDDEDADEDSDDDEDDEKKDWLN